MSQAILKEAQSKLALTNIYLKNSIIDVHEDIHPNTKGIGDVHVLKKMFVEGCEGYESSDDINSSIYLFKVSFGFIYSKNKNIESEDDILTKIEATYIAQYISEETLLEDELINTFGKHNVPYHVWPYWREYLQSTLQRMELPTHTLPMLMPAQVKKKQDKGD